MNNTIKLAAVAFMIATLCACESKNSILSNDADSFAVAVNNFMDQSFANDGVVNCAVMYNSQTINGEMQKNCRAVFIKLADYLNQNPKFKGITVNSLETKGTWQHYYASSHARGKGM